MNTWYIAYAVGLAIARHDITKLQRKRMLLAITTNPCAALLPELYVSIKSFNGRNQFSIQVDSESPEAATDASAAALHTTFCAYNMSRIAYDTHIPVTLNSLTAVSAGM